MQDKTLCAIKRVIYMIPGYIYTYELDQRIATGQQCNQRQRLGAEVLRNNVLDIITSAEVCRRQTNHMNMKRKIDRDVIRPGPDDMIVTKENS
jgi:hypothetical protein